MDGGLGRWDPLTVEEVTGLLAGAGAPWWIAGGWAIDLHVGRVTRPHDDVDVLVLRPDVPAFGRVLRGWDLQGADPPGALRPLGAELPPHVHDIWCRPTPAGPWRFQFLVSDAEDGMWLYRRDPRVRLPVAALDGPASLPGRRVLAPEVQLLHKSARPRPKDVADLRAALPVLSPEGRAWLRSTLPAGHPWSAVL